MWKNFFALLLLPLLFACTKKEDEGEKPPVALVTIAPYATFTKMIAGDTLKVEVLMPPGVNIHTYEPSPKSAEAAIQARVWFRIDEQFEQKLIQVIKEQNPSQKIVNLQEGLPLISSDAEIELGGCDHDHGPADLHTWMSPRLALMQAEKIYLTLTHLFPQHADKYEGNYGALKRHLQKLDEELTHMLEPFKGAAVLVSHPAFGYFCNDYGLLQLSVECEGKDPKPQDIDRIFDQAQSFSVHTCLLQQGFNNRGAELIATKLGITTHMVDPFAADYFQNLLKIAGYVAQ